MEESLRSWLFDACSRFTPLDDLEDLSELERCRRLGVYLFSLQHQSSIDDIKIEISQITSFDITSSNDIYLIIEALLICAVSGNNSEKHEFVQQIMSMDPLTQSFLMQAIKDNLHKHRSGNIIRTEQRDDYTRDICPICELKEKEIGTLKQSSSEKDIKYIEMEKGLQQDLAIQKNKLAEAELEILDRDHNLSQKEKEIDKLKWSLTDLQKKVDSLPNLTQEIETLKDQLDVFRPKADRADAAEAQLEKLREKFDELQGLRTQLRRETEMHTDTQNRLLEVEQELDTYRKYKSQLDEYRQLYTEASVTIQELNKNLQLKEKICQELEHNREQLVGGNHDQFLQTKRLAEELQETSEQLRGLQRNHSLGDGISELNPTLMLELTRLRAENKDLASKLDATSVESLEKLEKSLEDQKCLCESMQGKWMASKDAHHDALQKIAHLTASLTKLQQEYASMEAASGETSLMASEDRDSLMFEKRSSEFRWKRKLHHSLQLAHTGTSALVHSLCERLQSTTSDLNASNQTNDQLRELNHQLNELLVAAKDEISALKATIDNNNKDYENKLSALRDETTKEIEGSRRENESRVRSLESQHSVRVAAETAKCEALASEIEDERLKRRRVEREKKFQEAEAMRYRTQFQQIQASGSGGVVSVQVMDEATREIRCMQEQLEEAHKELAWLRNRSAQQGSTDDSMEVVLPEGSTNPSSSGQSRLTGATRIRAKDRGNHAGSSARGNNLHTFLEHSELVDKRLEQLAKEKRELLAKNLEENKERIELAQKLLQCEKELGAMKAKNTKLTLELERQERKMAKSLVAETSLPYGARNDDNLENSVNGQNASNIQAPSKTTRRLFGGP